MENLHLKMSLRFGSCVMQIRTDINRKFEVDEGDISDDSDYERRPKGRKYRNNGYEDDDDDDFEPRNGRRDVKKYQYRSYENESDDDMPKPVRSYPRPAGSRPSRARAARDDSDDEEKVYHVNPKKEAKRSPPKHDDTTRAWNDEESDKAEPQPKVSFAQREIDIIPPTEAALASRKSGRYDDEDIEEVTEVQQPLRIRQSASNSVPFIMLAPENGGNTDLVQCEIRRDRSSMEAKLYPTYRLILQGKNIQLMLAKKMSLNKTSNYHIFDMTRGLAGSKLTKKSGNYLGKLRALDLNSSEYVLLTRSADREELAGIVFDRVGMLHQLREGCQPRKMTVTVPHIDAYSQPIPHVQSSKSNSLVDMIKNSNTGRVFVLQSKDPVFENGNYRLNFHGRVNVPSVKNFQLSSPDDPGHIVCQFGKVADDIFHLDYKAPLNAMQAFALALCHFNV